MYGRRSKGAYESYRNNSVEMQSQGRLVYMLYEGVVRFCMQARRAIEAKEIGAAHENIVKAQNILYELMNTLRLEVGPISSQLLSLYDYMLRQLVQANLKKQQPEVALPLLEEVQELMEELAETWKAIL